MIPIKTRRFPAILSCLFLMATISSADTATYTLENLLLEDGQQITGSFVWTYDAEDFEGGAGEFSALEIPYTLYSLEDENLTIDVQAGAIEITGNGDYHDQGLDIKIVLAEPLSLTQSAPIDLDLSFFECCGNGFHDQPFQSGSVSPAQDPGLELAGLVTRRGTCSDKTTGERDVIRLFGATSWSCAEAGILPQGGDIVQLVTVGSADGLVPVGATLTEITPLVAKCRNLTTGMTVQVHPAGNSTVDCEAEGLEVTPGDKIMFIGMGLVGDF